MTQIDLSTLSTIPYLDLSDIRGRTISSLCFHDGDWKMWINAGDRLIQTRAWPAESFYFAREPEQQTDLVMQSLNFIAQRASFPELMKAFIGYQDDIFNLSASLAKIGLLHLQRDIVSHGLGRMVVTEVEYILSLCRSVFDLLQEMVCCLWKSVKLLDQAQRTRPLKASFADMILYSGQPASEMQIREKYGLPKLLAQIYAKYSKFFLSLRKIRDSIVHRGSQVQTVFNGERGFLIARNLRPFMDWNIWNEEEREPNDLVPLLPALGLVVYKTLSASEEIFHALEATIKFPPPLVPGMNFFMRGYFNREFLTILRDAEERTLKAKI